MAKVSGSNSISFWGQFLTAAGATGLPNTAGATKQNGNLEAGDIAYVTANSLLYVCRVATMGSAIWEAQPFTNKGPYRAVGGNTDTILSTDLFVFYSFAGAVAVTLPNLSASLPTNLAYDMLLQQTNAATVVTVTNTAVGGTIDGLATLVLPIGIASAPLRSSDGTIWFSQ